ncbi:1979_t:CDS:1 [Funneliformis geosporum]|uniref:1886_t:CDS:1 n=1 Tax=Funneliformis geosporum TaxID=1117311 RepID=A0A9W4SJG9_9GLOM|nr:1979_t:CDS:1 [Funneliformis geosporum]CAI2171658.1 1886_t:CDS:1 [Funneliformis geosporum]
MQESDITHDSSVPFIQNDVKNNVDNDTSNDPFYELIENQAKEFKEFGKQMSLDLFMAYKEHLNQDEESVNMENESKKDCECKEQIIAQEQLIDSLRARIEELETDSMIKNQDIKKLRQDFIDLKGSILESSIRPSKDESRNEPSNSIKDDNFGIQMETSEIKEVGNSSLYIDHTIKSPNKVKFVEPSMSSLYKKKFVKPLTPFNQYNEYPSTPFQYNEDNVEPSIYQQYNEDNFEPLATFQHYNEDNYETSKPYQQYNKSYVEPSTYNQQYNEEFFVPSTPSHQYNEETFTKVPTSYHEDDIYNNNEPLWISEAPSTTINYQQKLKQQQVNSKLQKVEQKLEEPTISNSQNVFAKITKVLEDENARNLIKNISLNQLLKYEKSTEISYLIEKSQRLVKRRINEMLRDELSKDYEISQPISIYAARGMIPPLPKGIKSYTEFQRTASYVLLSGPRKQRINKVISKEQMMVN